jgi:hypothetical protein
MTAPAAPHIRARSANGIVVRVFWQPIEDATDYKLYVGPTSEPTGLEADIADDEIGEDGWFEYSWVADDVDSYFFLTALNALAEESDPSDELHFRLTGPG